MPKNGKGIWGTMGGGVLTASVSEGVGVGGVPCERMILITAASLSNTVNQMLCRALPSQGFSSSRLFKGALLTSLPYTSFPSLPPCPSFMEVSLTNKAVRYLNCTM